MGIKKTADNIQSAFYWPGIQGGEIRYCKSCDVCQKPFKRVAIDVVGPISPPSEDGHRYILALVEFATRYPEAVPFGSAWRDLE